MAIARARDRLPEIRNHAITALGLTDMRALGQRDYGDIYSFSVDAALERYAVAERSGTVVVHRLDDHRELVRLPAPEQRGFWHAETMFSPDGELLVAVLRRVGRRWRSVAGVAPGTSGTARQVCRTGEVGRSTAGRSPPTAVAFCSVRRRGASASGTGASAGWSGGCRWTSRRTTWRLDPEGRRLAVNNADGAAPRVAILELESGRVLADWRSQVGNTNLAWSADGQLLAIGSYSDDCRVYVWNVRRGELASVLQGHTSYIINAQFAHTGYLLATASWRRHDPAVGCRLRRASGDRTGICPGFRAG